MSFWKYEYWNRNSLSFPPLRTVFRLTFAEWKVFLLVPQFSGGELRAGAVGLAVRVVAVADGQVVLGGSWSVSLPTARVSRTGRSKTPSFSGKSPSVFTACVVSCWTRSADDEEVGLVLL